MSRGSLLVLALVVVSLSACKKEMVSVKIFRFPDDTNASSEAWTIAARVQEVSRNRGGLSADGPRIVKVSFDYPDRVDLSVFEMEFSNDVQLELEGKWLNDESFNLEIGGVGKLEGSGRINFSASYIFRPNSVQE